MSLYGSVDIFIVNLGRIGLRAAPNFGGHCDLATFAVTAHSIFHEKMCLNFWP